MYIFSDQISASQPEFRRFTKIDLDSTGDDERDGDDGCNWFSQPVHPDHMLLSSQSPNTQSPQVRYVIEYSKSLLSRLESVFRILCASETFSFKPSRFFGFFLLPGYM